MSWELLSEARMNTKTHPLLAGAWVNTKSHPLLSGIWVNTQSHTVVDGFSWKLHHDPLSVILPVVISSKIFPNHLPLGEDLRE